MKSSGFEFGSGSLFEFFGANSQGLRAILRKSIVSNEMVGLPLRLHWQFNPQSGF